MAFMCDLIFVWEVIGTEDMVPVDVIVDIVVEVAVSIYTGGQTAQWSALSR